MPSNLWPDFEIKTAPRSPGRILREEGVGVSERTDGIVKFVVETHGTANALFEHTAYLSVPSINFRYPLLRVEQKLDSWPVLVVSNAQQPQSQEALNADDFLAILGKIFRSDQVKNIVRQLVDAAQGETVTGEAH